MVSWAPVPADPCSHPSNSCRWCSVSPPDVLLCESCHLLLPPLPLMLPELLKFRHHSSVYRFDDELCPTSHMGSPKSNSFVLRCRTSSFFCWRCLPGSSLPTARLKPHSIARSANIQLNIVEHVQDIQHLAQCRFTDACVILHRLIAIAIGAGIVCHVDSGAYWFRSSPD